MQEGIADAFYAQLKKRAEAIPIGDPLSPDTRLGPVVSEAQYKKILAFIEARWLFWNSFACFCHCGAPGDACATAL